MIANIAGEEVLRDVDKVNWYQTTTTNKAVDIVCKVYPKNLCGFVLICFIMVILT